MKRRILTVVSAVLLTACSEADSSQAVKDTTTMTTRPRPQSYYYDEEQPVMLTVKPKSYTEGMLTYEYDGKEYTLPLEYSVINDPDKLNRPSLSERLITNYGGSISAEIVLDDKKENIIFFDLLRPNNIRQCSAYDLGQEAGNAQDDQYANFLIMRRVSFTELEISAGSRTIRIDMNDLPTYYKGNIPYNEDVEVSFMGYIEGDDKLLPLQLFTSDRSQVDLTTEGKIAFCATVQSISDGRATVILNDDKTVCDVPCGLTDGELSVGKQVAVILDEDKSLYNSGKAYKSDYAVFVTLYRDYIPATMKVTFEDCAYFKQSRTGLYLREPVLKKNV